MREISLILSLDMMEISLVRLARAYSSHRGISVARVGFLAADDGKFIARLESGKTCTLRTADRVSRWLSEHWPSDLEWPPDIPRPEPTLDGNEGRAA